MQLLALVRLRRPLTVERLNDCSQTIEANRVRIFHAHAIGSESTHQARP
jgi:hypothetical protein